MNKKKTSHQGPIKFYVYAISYNKTVLTKTTLLFNKLRTQFKDLFFNLTINLSNLKYFLIQNIFSVTLLGVTYSSYY